jgi:hypothetical protein
MIRVKGQPQQALLIAFCPQAIAKIEKWRVTKFAFINDTNGTALFHDKQLAGAVPRVGEEQRRLQAMSNNGSKLNSGFGRPQLHFCRDERGGSVSEETENHYEAHESGHEQSRHDSALASRN